ncbi:hypothetical protein A2574_00340 [Candidatus Shapirobacteria bacterium RIFOXYD1_FULL_38_32]|uniref:HNH endonuclease n=3 Tax=Candidatus Shapironibacteriota TaxID=1752721 RepID=A0A0G0M3V6_9BACT|nr:MAG: hypothetical protein US90_C0025G0018 [Candidatus Shapirobacteria bacterium GW2011_GWE2_38_30]KKQ90228.1 MAG: hypothetical protein UT14_C0042G0010 [Candidatus Shapirobacteria bacterium GW2011_GWE1_38_92]OGL56122.1 MAG: hypothetical protein A2367_00260 [Candidatus Shapirobacteria bacterium RIFOXYB1_FULL_38_38]OGL56238.1 MAG: hypothetical protein A2195_00790 [Candidatus Shapirobacteria bacterium RIFOXYA1_FULL_39_17]OGL57723.1 MAG: hypothetical protein A2410_02750 [Candidatus Shapirobacteri
MSKFAPEYPWPGGNGGNGTGKLSKGETRQILMDKQGGVSPLTGRRLSGILERHHVKELANGGDKFSLANQQLIPRAEHVGEHLVRSRDTRRTPEDQEREWHTAMGRISELNDDELRDFNEYIGRRGVKVRFY